MVVQQIAKNKNDEYYTPAYAVKPILKYTQKFQTIWCPFDKKNSEFVKQFSESGHEVIYTHIDNGCDFLKVENENIQCDAIISNPPFSIRTTILQKLFEIDKPFAMLIGVVGLFESQKRFDMFKNNKFEIMYLNRRVSFLNQEGKATFNPPFQSVYICHNILPQQLIFEEINKNEKIS